MSIMKNRESADVSYIMMKIQNVVDESIVNKVSEPHHENGNVVDLSGLNFELLKKHFLKTTHKNAAIQSLKSKIESQLKSLVDRNPLKVDYYKRYQEIIDEYNRGKDEMVIQDIFRKLIEFVNSLSEEEADTKREGLDDEQKAIFDILRQGKELEPKEKKVVKEISKELLAELKKEKLRVDQWSEKSTTAASVFNYVSNTFFERLPSTYLNEDIDLKTNQVYEHLKSQYFGGGVSIYGAY